MTRLLSGDDVGAVLTLPDCIAAVERVFRDYATGSPPESESRVSVRNAAPSM